jgi:hypothetical protein
MAPPLFHLLPAELAIRSSDEVIALEISNMLACGTIVEVSQQEHSFFSPIFTVDKLERGIVYGKRVIIGEFCRYS